MVFEHCVCDHTILEIKWNLTKMECELAIGFSIAALCCGGPKSSSIHPGNSVHVYDLKSVDSELILHSLLVDVVHGCGQSPTGCVSTTLHCCILPRFEPDVVYVYTQSLSRHDPWDTGGTMDYPLALGWNGRVLCWYGFLFGKEGIFRQSKPVRSGE